MLRQRNQHKAWHCADIRAKKGNDIGHAYNYSYQHTIGHLWTLRQGSFATVLPKKDKKQEKSETALFEVTQIG